MDPLRICLVAAEVAPFAKTGGLADVAAGLPRALARLGHDVRVFMPGYRRLRDAGVELRPVAELDGIELRFGRRTHAVSVSRTRLPDSDVDVYCTDCDALYGRDALYSSDDDEHVRFAALTRAAVEACQRMPWAPDVFHCNDWHTAMLPLQLRTAYAWDRLFEASKTLLSIHNIGYQGVFGAHVVEDLGMGEQRRLLHQDDLNAGRISFLKTGLMYADALSTVSETYAREIQTAELGMGLDEILRARADVLTGIVNGVDYGHWDPASDPSITATYTIDDRAGKLENKRALLERFDLPFAEDVPVIGVVSRLTGQKGFELLPDILPVLLHAEDLRLVVLGSGEEKYETYFQWLRDAFPAKVAFWRGYNDELAHWIEAGADLFLMPSRYEPCGLNQMYSLRYGTVPVVRRTGGLADTVRPFDRELGEGTGFTFDAFTPEALYDTLRWALEIWRDRPAWDRLVRNGMAEDFSWDRQCRQYESLYRRLAR